MYFWDIVYNLRQGAAIKIQETQGTSGRVGCLHSKTMSVNMEFVPLLLI